MLSNYSLDKKEWVFLAVEILNFWDRHFGFLEDQHVYKLNLFEKVMMRIPNKYGLFGLKRNNNVERPFYNLGLETSTWLFEFVNSWNQCFYNCLALILFKGLFEIVIFSKGKYSSSSRLFFFYFSLDPHF